MGVSSPKETFGATISASRREAGLSRHQLVERLNSETEGERIDSLLLNDVEHDRVDPRPGNLLERLSVVLQLDEKMMRQLADKYGESRRLRTLERVQAQEAIFAFRRPN